MPVLCFLLFFISEILDRKYPRNRTKSITPSIKDRGDHGVRRGPGGLPRGPRHRRARPRWGPRRAMAWWPHLAPDVPLLPIKSPSHENLNRSLIFHEKFRPGRHRQSQIGGVLKLFPAPCRRGDHHRRPLHRNACLRSDA